VTQDRIDIARQKREEAARDEAAKQRHMREVNDFKSLMGQRFGRRIVYALLEKCGVYRSSFTGNSETFFNEGKRDIGLSYLAMVNEHCPDEFVAMLKEHKEDRDGDRRNS